MSSSGERGGDDPHVLQSLKGGHRNNGITSKDVLTLAHTQREGEGGRVASGGLDRSVRVWKATA